MRKTIVTIGWQNYLIDPKHVTALLAIAEELVAVGQAGYSGPYRPLLQQPDDNAIDRIQVIDYDPTPLRPGR